MKNNHLSEVEITSLLIEPEKLDKGLQVHLKKCPQCRNRIADLEGFTAAFRQYIQGSEINWKKQRQQVLAGLPESRFPLLRPRWATGFVLLFIVVAFVFLLSQRVLISPKTMKTSETELLEAIYVFSEDLGEVELPGGLQALSSWEPGDFRRFLNFFSAIEEDSDEKKDTTSDNLRSPSVKRTPVA